MRRHTWDQTQSALQKLWEDDFDDEVSDDFFDQLLGGDLPPISPALQEECRTYILELVSRENDLRPKREAFRYFVRAHDHLMKRDGLAALISRAMRDLEITLSEMAVILGVRQQGLQRYLHNVLKEGDGDEVVLSLFSVNELVSMVSAIGINLRTFKDSLRMESWRTLDYGITHSSIVHRSHTCRGYENGIIWKVSQEMLRQSDHSILMLCNADT